MSDWAVGDLALCRDTQAFYCDGHFHKNYELRPGSLLVVRGIKPNYDGKICGLGPTLLFDGGVAGLAKRFVKLGPLSPEEHASEIKMLADEQLLELIMPGKDHPHA